MPSPTPAESGGTRLLHVPVVGEQGTISYRPSFGVYQNARNLTGENAEKGGPTHPIRTPGSRRGCLGPELN